MPNFFINVKEKGAKKASGNIKSLTGSMKMMALQAVSVAAVMQGLKKSIQLSAEFEGVKRGFDNLAKSSGFSAQAFDNFKNATDGTIGSLELMKKANSAMLLGITDSEDQMANMFDVAQRLGQSLGIDTTRAIDSLVTGLGRQCLTSDSFISTKDGLKQIIDIKEGDIVLSRNNDGDIIETEVTHLHNNGTQPIYIVTFRDGRYIKSTDNHRYLTDNGWKYLSELDSGSKVLNIENEYSEIYAVDSFGEEEVYDLTVPETANFFANGLNVHNSKLMLDNLGIMVDTNKAYRTYADSVGKTVSQLTDQERKTAFVNAGMREANKLVAQLGEEELTTADAMAQVVTAASDAAISLGNLLAPTIIRAAELFVGAAEAVDKYFFSLRTLDAEEIKGVDSQELLMLQINKTKQAIYDLHSVTSDMSVNFGTMNQASQQERDEMERLETQLAMLKEQLNSVNILMLDAPPPSVLALAPVIDENAIALEAYEIKQEGVLANYTKEQEMIEALILKNPELAASLKLVTDETKKQQKTQDDLRKDRKKAAKGFVTDMQTMAKVFPEMEKAAKRAAQVQALVDAYASANAAYKAMVGIAFVGPGLAPIAAAAAVATARSSFSSASIAADSIS